LQRFLLAGAFRHAPRQGLARIHFSGFDEVALFAALRFVDRHLTVRLDGQRLGEKSGLRRRHRDIDLARRLAGVVKLRDERIEHDWRLVLLVVLRKEGVIAPVLPRPEKEYLHAGLPAFRVNSEHISLANAARIDVLRALNIGKRADAVAQFRGAFKIEIGGSLFHLFRQGALNLRALAGKKRLRLVHKLFVVFGAHQSDAGRGATLDLVQQARARAAFVNAVRAGAQEKRFLQRVQCAVDGAGGSERAVIGTRALLRAAMFQNLRRLVVFSDENERKRFVVAQDDVVTRLELLDQIRFKQQRLCLRRGDDKFHGAGFGNHPSNAVGMAAPLRVGGDPIFEILRLAHIENVVFAANHAVNAGPGRQARHLVSDQRRAGKRRVHWLWCWGFGVHR